MSEIRRRTRAVRRRVRRTVDDIDVRYPSLGGWLQYGTIALLVLFTIGVVAYALQAASSL